MVKLLLDENLRSDALWQAISAQRQSANLLTATDIQRVGDHGAPQLGTDDERLLELSAAESCIIVSVDRGTLPGFFDKLMRSGGHSPGLIMLRGGLTIPEAAEVLVTISYAGDAAEFADQCNWVP